MNKTKEKILEIIREYRELAPDYTDINELMYKRKLLSTYGANLAVEVGKARANWKLKNLKYEVNKNQKHIIFYQKQGNLGKAEIYAKANTEDLQKESVKAENIYYELDYIFKALRETLGDLNQRIAHLREELKQDRFYNNLNN